MNDYVLRTINPDGSISLTPIRGDDPAYAEAIRAGQAYPMDADAREGLGTLQAESEYRERMGNLPAPQQALLAAVSGADEMSLGAISRFASPERREALQAAEEANPVTSGAARLAPWVGPALITGGASTAGATGVRTALGALARFTPGGLAEGVGALATRGAARAGFTSGLNTALGLATEGAVAGGLDAFTMQNREGTPLDGEEILAGAGLGALTGFGVAGLATGAQRALRFGRGRVARNRLADDLLGDPDAAARIADQPPDVGVRPRDLPDLANAPEGRIDYNPGEVPEADFGGRFGAAARRLGGVDEQQFRQVVGADRAGIDPFDAVAQRDRTQRAAELLEDGLNEVERRGARMLDRRERLAAARRQGVQEPNFMDEVVAREYGNAPGRARGILRDGLDVFDGAAGRIAPGGQRAVLDRLTRVLRSDGPEGVLERLDNILEIAGERPVLEAMSAGDAQSTALVEAIFGSADAVDGPARGGLIALLSELGPGGRALAEAHRARLVGGLRSQRPNVFGQLEVTPGGRAWRLDAPRLGQALQGGLGEVPRRDMRTNVQRILDNAVEQENAYDNLFGPDVDPTARRGRDRLREGARALEEADVGSRVREALVRAQMDEKQSAGVYAALGLSGAFLGNAAFGGEDAGVGGAIGGAGAGLLLASATHPVGAYRLARRLGMGAAQTRSRIQSGQRALARSLRRREFSERARGAVSPLVASLRSPEHREENYEEVRNRIVRLATNPDALERTLAETSGVIADRVDPAIGDGMARAQVAGVQYLYQNLPAADDPTLFESVGDRGATPSLVEMTSFLRRVEALEAPADLLHWAAAGVLEVEHVEAVSAVYPLLFAAVQEEATRTVAEVRTLPSYQQRITLGVLLGVPTDRSLTGRTVAALQQSYAQTTAQQRTNRTRGGRTRSISASYSDDTLTTSQSIQETIR